MTPLRPGDTVKESRDFARHVHRCRDCGQEWPTWQPVTGTVRGYVRCAACAWGLYWVEAARAVRRRHRRFRFDA